MAIAIGLSFTILGIILVYSVITEGIEILCFWRFKERRARLLKEIEKLEEDIRRLDDTLKEYGAEG